MRLSKRQMAQHNKAEALLLKEEALTDREVEFFFDNWNEAANHDVGRAGAFFTPLDLAYDFALEAAFDGCKKQRVIELCAGIGVLAYAVLKRNSNADIVCVEANPRYVEIGKKLVPQAQWICGSVEDTELLQSLGYFNTAISNPPFGRVPTMTDVCTEKYTGGLAEYKVIELSSCMADYGVFLLPQESAGFSYSGVQCYERKASTKYARFEKETGIELGAGCGIDTTAYSGFKNTSITCEIATTEFHEGCEWPLPKVAESVLPTECVVKAIPLIETSPVLASQFEKVGKLINEQLEKLYPTCGEQIQLIA